jgi:hypothetical protein
MDMKFRDRGKHGDAMGRHRRWLTSIALLVVMGLTFVPIILYAVHDLDFQLDGDIAAATDAFPFPGVTANVDWDSIFDANGNSKLPANPPATGFRHAAFAKDFGTNANGSFDTSDDTTYTTGSKDTLPITPGWQCTVSNNVNSKTDIINAYAVDYVDPVSGEKILYFGMERNVNTGDANIAFWFLQGEANCESPGGTTPWTGHHTDGDILIVSAFTKGGKVSGIDAYAWACPTATTAAECDALGNLNTVSIAPGFDCRSSQAFNGHDPIPAGDKSCAAANLSAISDIPWLTVKKTTVGHSLDVAEFYEGGINLTKSGFGDLCFNTFVGDTRSSQELGATIFDYARGVLGECNATLTTTPSSGGANYGTAVLPGTSVTDTANITVGDPTNPTPTGNVTFFLCGPSQLTPQNTGVCSSGGSQVGSPVAIADAGGDATHGDGTATSAAVNTLASPLTPGRYCFRAEWPGDTNYKGPFVHSGTGNSECFLVKDTSTTTTTQEWVPNDNATVTAGSSGTPVSGSVKFTLYGDSTCGQSGGGILYDPPAISVSGTGSATASTSNTSKITATPTVDGGVSWKVVFTPTDANILTGSQHCEKTVITITN